MVSTTDRSVRAWASRGTLEGVEEAEEALVVTGTEGEGVEAEVGSEGDAVASAVTAKGPEEDAVASAAASAATATGSDGDVVASAVTVMGSEGDAVVLAAARALGITTMMMSMVQMAVTRKDSGEMERVASGEDEAEALATAGALGIAMMIPMDSITEMIVEEDLEVAEALEIAITVIMGLMTAGLEVVLVIGMVVDLRDVGIGGEGVEVLGGDSIRAQA